MTTHEQSLLTHILNGGAITIPAFDEPIQLDYIGNQEDKDISVGLDELGQCEIHHTPDQLIILKLKQELADMTDKLKEITQQKSKLGANLREVNGSGPTTQPVKAYRAHLSQKEVTEIEQVIKQDYSTPNSTIMNSFGISSSVMWRIRNARHSKSTNSFRNHLRNINQLKD